MPKITSIRGARAYGRRAKEPWPELELGPMGGGTTAMIPHLHEAAGLGVNNFFIKQSNTNMNELELSASTGVASIARASNGSLLASAPATYFAVNFAGDSQSEAAKFQYSNNNGGSWIDSPTTDSALINQTYYNMAYGNGRFIAVGRGPSLALTNIAATSTDGINWSQLTLPTATNWSNIVYGNGKFVATTRTDNVFYYSSDGLTWTGVSVPAVSANGYYVLKYVGNKFISLPLANSNWLLHSEDGVTWTQQYLPTTINGVALKNQPIGATSTPIWSDIEYANGKYILIIYQFGYPYSNYSNIVYGISTNLIDWSYFEYDIDSNYGIVNYATGHVCITDNNKAYILTQLVYNSHPRFSVVELDLSDSVPSVTGYFTNDINVIAEAGTFGGTQYGKVIRV